MLLTLPPRLVRRSLPLAVAAISFACSDNPAPLAPHAPTRAKLLEAPVVVVTNTDDAGAGSLRQAIADAPDGASIQFDAGIAGRTIVLTSGELFIDKPLTVEGPVTVTRLEVALTTEGSVPHFMAAHDADLSADGP